MNLILSLLLSVPHALAQESSTSTNDSPPSESSAAESPVDSPTENSSETQQASAPAPDQSAEQTAVSQPDAPPASESAQAEPEVIRTGVIVKTQVAATVYIDNQEAGQTPYTGALSPGKHKIRVLADGYNPVVRRVTVKDGRLSKLNLDLELGGGTIEFDTNRSSAKLTIDGKLYQMPIRVSATEIGLADGEHEWKISAQGYEPAEGQLSFSQGRNIFIYRELESSSGKVIVESTPVGADVYLDGDKVGLTPLFLEGIDSSVHSVWLKKKGYASVFRTMDTSDGSKGKIKSSMTKMGASLVVRTNDSKADVYIEDTLVGTGKRVKLSKIAPGLYEIRIQAPKRKSVRSNINVPPRGSLSYKAKLPETESSSAASLKLTRGGSSTGLAASPVFWGALGTGSLLTAAGTWFIIDSMQPEPAPSGDTVLTLP